MGSKLIIIHHQKVIDNDAKVPGEAYGKIVTNGSRVGRTLGILSMTIVLRDLVPIIAVVGVKR
jgi:hypothetical protein